MSPAPSIEQTLITGPAGKLELRVERGPQDAGAAVGVLCHPHPQYGGTMDNKVVHTLAAAFREAAIPSVRFNFRGVGHSQGGFGDADGELQDLLAVAAYAREQFPDRVLWLAGFSFGAGVAARAAARLGGQGLVLVAPPVVADYFAQTLPSIPTLVIHGDRDELIALADVQSWLQAADFDGVLHVLEGADHFFHGQLRALRGVVTDFLSRDA